MDHVCMIGFCFSHSSHLRPGTKHMAFSSNQFQKSYNQRQNEAPLYPFPPIVCLAVIVTLSGAACGWLKHRKGRNQVSATPQKEGLVMAAKHGLARLVSVPLFLSNGGSCILKEVGQRSLICNVNR